MQIVNPRVAPHSCSAFIGIKRQAGAGCCVAVGSIVGFSWYYYSELTTNESNPEAQPLLRRPRLTGP